MDYIISVDIGTTFTKVALYNSRYRSIAILTKRNRIYFDSEKKRLFQKADDFYKNTVLLIKDLLSKVEINKDEIKCIIISSQQAGIIGIDHKRVPVTEYDTGLDNNSAYLYKVIAQDKNFKNVINLNGASPTYLQKILWWKDKYPEMYEQIYKFIQPTTYVVGKLCDLSLDEVYQDYSTICYSGLAEVRYRKWSKVLCDYFDIDIERLPSIVSPNKVVGRLRKEIVNTLGLSKDVIILAGIGDLPASLLGSGIFKDGQAMDISATATCIGVCIDNYYPDTENFLYNLVPHYINNKWIAMHYIISGGENFRWFYEKLKIGYKSLDLMFEALNKRLDFKKDNILYFLPHLSGRITPAMPEFRGAYLGFSLNDGIEKFYYSMMCSIGFEYKIFLDEILHKFDNVKIKDIRVIGGGAKNKLWNQIKTNIIGINYVKAKRTDQTTLGTALIAGGCLDANYNLENQLENVFDIEEEFFVDIDTKIFFAKHYENYKYILENVSRIYANIYRS